MFQLTTRRIIFQLVAHAYTRWKDMPLPCDLISDLCTSREDVLEYASAVFLVCGLYCFTSKRKKLWKSLKVKLLNLQLWIKMFEPLFETIFCCNTSLKVDNHLFWCQTYLFQDNLVATLPHFLVPRFFNESSFLSPITNCTICQLPILLPRHDAPKMLQVSNISQVHFFSKIYSQEMHKRSR